MISIIVPCYNEEESVPLFYEEATKVLAGMGYEYELLFVNDGSVDNTGIILKTLAADNPAVRIVEFARNFGHEAAMIAGIDYAQGDYLICMDSDLQHPPKLLPDILQKFEEGFDVVSMVRIDNPDAGFMSKFFSGSFYKLLNLLSPVKFEKTVLTLWRFQSRLRMFYAKNIGKGFVICEGTCKVWDLSAQPLNLKRLHALPARANTIFQSCSLFLSIPCAAFRTCP